MVKDNTLHDRGLVSSSTCKIAATALLARGFWPVAVYPPGIKRPGRDLTKGKEPIGEKWGLAKITVDQIKDRFDRYPGVRVGTTVGPGRGPKGEWICDFEGDGPETGNSYRALMGPDIPVTMSWTSCRAPHNVFIVEERFAALLARCKPEEGKGPGKVGVFKLAVLPDLEIRLGGWKEPNVPKQVQSLVPPSLGDDGKPREWIHGPECLATLPEAAYEFLEAYAEGIEERAAIQSEPPNGDGQLRGPRVSAGKDRGDSYAAGRALRNIIDEFKRQTAGNRHGYACAKSNVLASMVLAGWISGEECLAGFKLGALDNGMGVERFGEIEELWRSALERVTPHAPLHERNGRQAKESSKESTPLSTKNADSLDSLASLELCTERASNYKARPVEFLDGGIIPAGKLIAVVGMGGAGKGMWEANLIADFSRGRQTMGMEYEPSGPIEVLMIGCEDGYEDTVIPRLRAANADMDNIHIVKGVKNKKGKILPFSMAHLDVIDRYLALYPNIKFISISPIAGYVGRAGIDEHNDAELRSVLEPSGDLASTRNVTIMGVKHFNKDEAKSVSSRVSASIAYVNVPRACFAVGPDPANPHRRVLAPFKWNLNVPWPPSIVWSMELADEALIQEILEDCADLTSDQKVKLASQLYRLHWEGEVKVNADDMLDRISSAGRKSAREDLQRATIWLGEKLRNGPILARTCAEEGEKFMGRPWPSPDGITPEEHNRRCNGRIKWWRETILVERLNGEVGKHGFQGQSYFLFPDHRMRGLWPPK